MEITTIQFTDDMLKDVLKLDFATGGNEPVWHNTHRGRSMYHQLSPKISNASGNQQAQ